MIGIFSFYLIILIKVLFCSENQSKKMCRSYLAQASDKASLRVWADLHGIDLTN